MESVVTERRVATVVVDGWRYDRRLIVEDRRALLEVARTADDCHLCNTCRARADLLEQKLRQSNQVWTWELFDGGKWLALPLTEGVDPVRLFVEAVGLTINGVKPTVAEAKQAQPSFTRKWAYVSHWQNRRAILVQDDRVLFQVTLSCRHCRTCSERRQTVLGALRGSSYVWKEEYLPDWQHALFVSLARQPGEDPVELVNKATGLGLKEIEVEKQQASRKVQDGQKMTGERAGLLCFLALLLIPVIGLLICSLFM